VNKPAILVVDDDAQVLAAVRRDLRSKYQKSYTVIGASSGEEALATIRELKARGDTLAVVISDQRMPGIQGTDVLAQSLDVYPLAGRVLLTAYADIDAAIKAINVAHLSHYLSKPWDPPEESLFPVIDDLLDTWQAAYLPETTGLRLVGHQWSPRSHEIKRFLGGNLIPYRWIDVAHSPDDTRTLLESAGIKSDELPVLFFEDGSALRNPEPRQVAEKLGRSLSAAQETYDLVIVGAGPAGLAENYLGFPAGVSGTDLTRRAVAQAQRLGAEFLVPLEVASLAIDTGYKHLTLTDGRKIVTRTLVAATGMEYREHPAEGISALTGAGVYYGTATTEAPVFVGQRVLVVGGGNSAGQAAMYLSRYAKDVQIVVRRDSLRDTMSHYLIEQIEKTPNIRLRGRTDLERVEGNDHVERVTLKHCDGVSQVENIDAVFVYIGARPQSDWLPLNVLRDDKGFVLTGRELSTNPAYPRVWKERREPMSLETSVPGVFAAGDVRAGAMNRVASAVGEGAMVVRFVHDYLSLT
jgi:thioredoxin reductase (NADPH)